MVIMNTLSPSFTLAAAFFQPLLDLPVGPRLSRTCHGIMDSEWLLLGASRVLGVDTTGRAFLDALCNDNYN